ncbi:MAG: ribonuclease Z [Deltaproteobacteria bacterium]|nr:ribonuclease Z [Deltaproteobacteria bacterium]
MSASFHPRLINDPFSDPGLYIAFRFQRRAILFDLGDLHSFSSRDLLKISHVFVTHAHMDHFIGFDTLLRTCLGRDRELHLFGPPGIFRHVEGKLGGYTWNLVDEYEYPFRLRVTEVGPEILRSRRYLCNKRFAPEDLHLEAPFEGVLLKEPSFRVEATLLDHRIPCLGLCLVENIHIHILKEELDALGLPTGPWITRFKKALLEEKDLSSEFAVTWEQGGEVVKRRVFGLGELAGRIAKTSPGQKICYVTDVAGDEKNRRKIRDLAGGASHLFIEAAFLDEDRELAREKYHLTARDAGEIASEVGAGQVTLFHFSPRYTGRETELEKEAGEAFSIRMKG